MILDPSDFQVPSMLLTELAIPGCNQPTYQAGVWTFPCGMQIADELAARRIEPPSGIWSNAHRLHHERAFSSGGKQEHICGLADHLEQTPNSITIQVYCYGCFPNGPDKSPYTPLNFYTFSAQCFNCDSQFSTQDKRVHYCPSCREPKISGALRAKRYRERHHNKNVDIAN